MDREGGRGYGKMNVLCGVGYIRKNDVHQNLQYIIFPVSCDRFWDNICVGLVCFPCMLTGLICKA